jgi:hypothetical protein
VLPWPGRVPWLDSEGTPHERFGSSGRWRLSGERVVVPPRSSGIDPPVAMPAWQDGSWSRFEGGCVRQIERLAGSNWDSVGPGPTRGRPGTSLVDKSTSNWTSSDRGARAALRSPLGTHDGRVVGDLNFLAVHPPDTRTLPRLRRTGFHIGSNPRTDPKTALQSGRIRRSLWPSLRRQPPSWVPRASSNVRRSDPFSRAVVPSRGAILESPTVAF